MGSGLWLGLQLGFRLGLGLGLGIGPSAESRVEVKKSISGGNYRGVIRRNIQYLSYNRNVYEKESPNRFLAV